ncbi:MAG: hypothetical protein ABIC95_02450 [archaeon]
MLRLFRTGWMDWEEYQRRVQFLDDFLFQQQVRKQNVNAIT